MDNYDEIIKKIKNVTIDYYSGVEYDINSSHKFDNIRYASVKYDRLGPYISMVLCCNSNKEYIKQYNDLISVSNLQEVLKLLTDVEFLEYVKNHSSSCREIHI